MKINFLLPSLKLGGGVSSTLELANRLQGRGHEVNVIYPVIPGRGGYSPTNVKKTAGRLLKAMANLRTKNELDWFGLEARLIRVPSLAERYIPDADIVVATWWENALTVNGYGREKGEKFYFIRHYETWGGPEEVVNSTYTLPVHRITTSTWLKDFIEEKFDVEVMGPLPNGVNKEIFYLERGGFAAHAPKRLGLMYRLNKWKGMEDGLLAVSMVRVEYPDVAIVIFGEEPTKEDAKVLEQIGGVEYHRSPHGDQLREIYNSLDIFLFPSHTEGFGRPPMEAMACGIACVATRVGAVSDYTIPGVTACVVEPGEPRDMAEALVGLLRDEPRRQEMARAGHEYVQRFEWERTVDELEKIFGRWA
ncbi:MAG: glycosyltransferase family 4 protein [Actinobacteria bacterium]|nr:glycosyltransferase family 4 protein [Actinomycetota bacterium]